MPQLIDVGDGDTISEKGAAKTASKGATLCSPDSVSEMSSKSEKTHTAQSMHNFADLTNLVKKKWYAKKNPSPSVPQAKQQLPLLVTTDESSPSPAQPKPHSPLLVSAKDMPHVKGPSPLPALVKTTSPPHTETVRRSSPKIVVSAQGSPMCNPSWYWPIQPYEHWSEMRPGTQEHVHSDSDRSKTVPFPPYVEPSVPGFDFMTGTVTEVGTSNQALPQSGDRSPLFTGVTTPTLEDVPAPMGHNSVPCSPDGHAVVHLPDAGHDFESIRPQTDDLPHLGMVQTTLGPDECSNCTNSSQASIRDTEIERLKATIDGLIKSLDQMEDERDAAIRMAHGASYGLADAHQAVYIKEGEIIEAKQVLLAEQLKVAALEEEMERRQRSFEDRLGKVREEYRKKSGECEVQREEMDEQEKLLEEAEQRVLVANQAAEKLCGAAHLVVPEKHMDFPEQIVSCFECYANSRECDNLSRCRNCVETLSKCARWRCGLYHTLGECSARCRLSHSATGWLTVENKPE